jgi:hypothetical protein
MSSLKVAVGLAAMIGLAAVSGACVAEPGAQTEPPGLATQAPTPTTVTPQAAAAADCYTARTGHTLRLTQDVTEESKVADLVAVGTVVAVTQTRWATGNGQEPVRAADEIPSVRDVYRLVTFRLSRVGKTGPQATTLIAGRSEIFIRADGGQIGCKKFEIDGEPMFEVGQEVAAFFRIEATNGKGAKLPGDFAVMDPWWIYKGKVLRPDGSSMSTDDFIAQSLKA